MTEDDAQAWISTKYGPAAVEQLAHYAALLTVENDQQNLIANSTIPNLWARHIVDSAQLLDHVPTKAGTWVDIGSGAGLPGIVVGALSEWRVMLVEPRRLRAAFLLDCIQMLGLAPRISVTQLKSAALEIDRPAAVISARAVAALPQLIADAIHLTDRETLWVLPKGSRAHSEVADAKRKWQGMFHVEPSVVDPDSGIVVASRIVAKR